MIRIFVGFDPQITVIYHVLAQSILSRSTEPVALTPITLKSLQGVFSRPRDPKQSTDFSFSRFLVPYLCNYEGWSIFMDNDVVVLDDIAKLWALRDENYAVQVVKHDYIPKTDQKFLGALQTKYVKKNWTSVMIFNNARCRALTPEYVNTASGLELHQFKWLESESEIGELPARWNHLVDEYDYVEDVSLLHYTEGGPYFEAYKHCDYADKWLQELSNLLYCKDGSLNVQDFVNIYQTEEIR